jgi:hypothetical protein
MQKKKPTFQAIPNYGVAPCQTGMNLKKVRTEQGRNDTGPRNSSTAEGPSARSIAIAERCSDIAIYADLRSPRTKWCIAIERACGGFGPVYGSPVH